MSDRDRLAELEEFLSDEGNYVGGVWGDYGQVVVDASDVWRVINGGEREFAYRNSDYVATLNQAREALVDCEERATTPAPALDVERLREALPDYGPEDNATVLATPRTRAIFAADLLRNYTALAEPRPEPCTCPGGFNFAHIPPCAYAPEPRPERQPDGTTLWRDAGGRVVGGPADD